MKKNNAHMPAMPTNDIDIHDHEGNGFDESGRYLISNGLTKREMIAMNMMNGILSNQGYNYNGFSGAAEFAIQAADALLRELEK